MYLRTTLKSIFNHKYLIKNFMVKDLKNRYQGSMMGFLWSIIHPLTTLAVYSLVFSWMLKMRVGMELGTNNFTLWMFAGLLPWIFFSETLSRATSVVLDNSNLIKKTVFPSEILPISLLLSNAVNFLIGFLILIGGMFFLGQHVSGLSLLYVLVYIFPLVLFTLGFCWLCASLNVFFRDLGQIVSVVLNIVFYASAIIYPIHVVPQKFQGWFFWNPLIHVVQGIRDALFKLQFIEDRELIYLYTFSIIVFCLGQYIFQKSKKGFVDVL
ncbi:ABC transporter permease [Paenibacillus polymyxa]|uniref:ABC transporter permease n=1 Tax=Paenibacillus polymyxa TaxID=1406 RepID=UPI00287FD4DF|nr:ABC transporter permease [Paenibacillus polymyxa]